VDTLVNFDQINTNVDGLIGQPGYVGYSTNGTFSPRTVITDASSAAGSFRWLMADG
jgi:hypothetical protein